MSHSQEHQRVSFEDFNAQSKLNGSILALLALCLFAVVCLSSVSTAKVMTLVVGTVTLVVMVVRRKYLVHRMSIPLLAVTLWVLFNGISTFYAVSGKFALKSFVVLLTSFCVAILILALANGRGRDLGRGSATILEIAGAISGLVSIDLISTRWISSLVLWILGVFTQDYAALTPVEVGVRMNSLFTNPNVFAGMMGIGVFLSLGLARTAQGKLPRNVHLVCLYVQALAFFMAFSMGASGTIAVGFLVYLFLERKEHRGRLLVIMVETLVLTAAAGFIISATALVKWTQVQPIPLVCLIVGAALLCVVDLFVGQRIASRLEGYTRMVPALIGGIVALLVVFALVAMQLTGPASLEKGETLRRAIYPKAGTYTLSVVADGDVTVTLESQNKEDTMMHTSSNIYSGVANGASVTVPEDSIVVYANFKTEGDVTIESVTLEGEGQSYSFPLNYTLLPSFIANRMQGLFANQNAIQRLVFFEDGLKLVERSPIVGLGMGAFENGIVSVQSFHYETKYAHNHYIESLVETGVIGVLLFVGVLVTAAIAVWKSWRLPEDGANPLTPALGGVLIFMAGHAAVEVVFSTYSYLPFALGVFALIALCCGQTMSLSSVKGLVRQVGLWVVAGLILVYGVLIACNLGAKMLSKELTFDAMETAIALDKFEWADYMVSYVSSSTSVGAEYPDIHQTAAEYALQLEQVDSNSIPIYLAEYYFTLGDIEKAYEMLEKYVNYVISDPTTWDQAFRVALSHYEANETVIQGLTHLYETMVNWNSENMGSITLSDDIMDVLVQLGIADK